MFDGVNFYKAKRQGLERYFDGDTCLFGHVSEKYVATKRCVECVKANISRRDEEVRLLSIRNQRVRIKRKSSIEQATPPWMKDAPFSIDHIVPIQGYYMLDGDRIEVCGLNVPWNVRIITKLENSTKSNRMTQQDLDIACSLKK